MPPTTTEGDNQLLDELESRLGALAARWRGTEDLQQADAIVRDYQLVLNTMLALGYHNWLDAESELPDRYMPAEYLSGDFLKHEATQRTDSPAADARATFLRHIAVILNRDTALKDTDRLA